MRRLLSLVLLVPALVCSAKQPFDVDALLRLQRIADPQMSPDGKWVTFSVTRIDVDKNTRPTQIWIVPLQGGTPRQITPEGGANQHARWMPDSKHIVFISSRSGSSQVWLMDPDGANPKQLSTIPTEASDVIVTPDGKKFLFSSEVYPDCTDDACNKRKLDQETQSKVKARSYTSLLYRHWNQFQSLRRKHLFVMDAAGGTARDLTPGPRDVPPFSLGGPDDFTISPESSEVCFVMNSDPQPATSTNSDLYVVPLEGGEAKKITANVAADNSPQYSPDGKYLAWRAQSRPGYESDRWRLMLLERATGKLISLTDTIDRAVGGFTWTRDSQRIFYTIEDRGRSTVEMIGINGGGTRSIIAGNSHIDDVQFTADGKTMIYTEQTGSRPTEIYRVASSGGAAAALAKLNNALLDQYELPALEDFWVESSDKARVQSFVVKPPNFDPQQKYPGSVFDPRRPAGRMGRELDVSLECAGVRRGRLSGSDAESTRFHRLRPEIHRRDQCGLGRQSLRRHHGGGGRSGQEALCGCGSHGCRGWLLWRLHGELAARPYYPIQGPDLACWCLRSAQHGR